MNSNRIVVVGLGEIGKPLLQVLSKQQEVMGIDINPPAELPRQIDVLHVCYPFEIKDFIGETSRYIELFDPALTIINSTVAIGTTRAVAERTGKPVVHSPVRGKHLRMLDELYKYTKFIGGIDAAAAQKAATHFQSAGLKTRILSSPEATELAKLTETTYFGVLIAWAQEVERYCDQLGANYDEIVSIYEEIAFFPPVKYTPGIIGGHCVMPNIEILRKHDDSQLLDAIRTSNQMKIARETRISSKVEELATAGAPAK